MLRGTLMSAGLALALATSLTAAEARSRVGTLDCTIEPGVGLIIGSSKGIACRFTSASGRVVERYTGRVDKIGLDIGVTSAARMVWAVVAETRNVPRGALAGTYVGASADASVGVGAGARLLVGGTGNAFSLQPLSIQGQAGVNLAVGVNSFTLVSIR